MANWYDELKKAFAERGEDFSAMACTLTEEQLRKEFDDSLGWVEGEEFTAWGANWVFFPVKYDGAEWVGSAPRHPCDIATPHQGGANGLP